IVMDPAFKSYLDAHPASAIEIAQSRSLIVSQVEAGAMSVSYDFGWMNDRISTAYTQWAAAPVGSPQRAQAGLILDALGQERERTSVAALGNTSQAATLALQHHGVATPAAALVSLVVARAGGDKSGGHY